MNPFTTLQLINNIDKPNNGGAVYYNTKSQSVNYTPFPILSIIGNNACETKIFSLKNKEREEKKEKEEIVKISKKKFTPKIKKIREQKPVSEEERCCENTLKGSQCKLRKYKNSELCFVHYNKYNKIVPIVEEVVKEPSRPKKWFASLKWW